MRALLLVVVLASCKEGSKRESTPTPTPTPTPAPPATAPAAEKPAAAPAADAGLARLNLPNSAAVDFTGYDVSCTTAADCTHVKSQPCDPCDCSRIPIAKRELPRYEAAAKSITCQPVGYACGKCTEGRGPQCTSGTCE